MVDGELFSAPIACCLSNTLAEKRPLMNKDKHLFVLSRLNYGAQIMQFIVDDINMEE